MPADYHTHTPLCHHAAGEPEAFVEAAMAAGLSEYGISDHAPTEREPHDDWRMSQADLPAYLEWIAAARSHARDRIAVRAGLECDWLKGCEGWIESLAARHPWDYLIGSVHYLDDWDFDNPKWRKRWQQEDLESAWEHYWKTYADMAKSGLFDILAHPDLIKKFGFQPTGDLHRYYEPAIAAIAAAGCAIELNTAGWHKPCEDAYPSQSFLELAHAADIPIVISSDAHHPSEVARDFGRAAALLRSLGYTEVALFKQRTRRGEFL